MKDERTKQDNQSVHEHIDGIICDVNNCIYNQQNQYCTATHIKVGPNFAATKNDTACVTFEHR